LAVALTGHHIFPLLRDIMKFKEESVRFQCHDVQYRFVVQESRVYRVNKKKLEEWNIYLFPGYYSEFLTLNCAHGFMCVVNA